MQAPGRDDDEGSDSMVTGAESPSGPGDSMGPGDADSTGAESAAAGKIPRSTEHHWTQGRLEKPLTLTETWEVSTLTVPFLSNVDAEVALRFLLPGADLYRGMVLWELSVTGSELFIRLTSEDAELLQISTFSLLIRLFIVRHVMQHLVFPGFR
ncbi:EKC/KEOPS complex subunit LAGE3-like [Phyllostomus hastatus]|uniref:EKC/KEOPS complex subunit LAGE3-like n=1 Tax=Phyllostomus hastatus TaxID=9423 RepID=UPI001E68270A|nr:EKC/KEOPS complex subunit LAGE3-like [Phyllostomus hastatus]